jgi:hypothetical protein
MPSTSVHLSAELLKQLDRAARKLRVSRNRLITEACRSVVAGGAHNWPRDFFATDRLATKDVARLRDTFSDWTANTLTRRSKHQPPF